ncbi:hypothetical protein AB0O74_32850 [Streptomyces rubiginosohelvolus]
MPILCDRPGPPLITDKGWASIEFETDLATRGVELLRPSSKREKRRKGEALLKPVRQLIESINDTLKGLIWNNTVVGLLEASPSTSLSASWSWPPRAGTTTRPAPGSLARSSPTTTDHSKSRV